MADQLEARSSQLAASPAPSVESREQMNIVIVGHVDHGKSTLVGRLLADTNSLPQGKLDKVKRECERTGKPFEYAFLLDALEDEQDQGITIDTARCFFKTTKRDYIIIDAPGHIEFLKNMISGAARAEAAVLMIDAKEGVRENSRRHGYILGMLGIKQVVVCVNKMDLVGYSQQVFDGIEKEYREFLTGIGAVSPKQFVPIAALTGENLTTRSQAMAWYKAPTMLELLDLFAKQPPKIHQPLRMPVQAIYKFTSHGDDRRIVSGRIDTGALKVGDEVVFSPSNKTVLIKSIEGFNTAPRTAVDAGWSTGVTLSQEIYITRGEVMSHKEHAPLVGTRFRANIIWLGRKAMQQGREYKLKLHTSAQPVRIHKLLKVLDASELNGELVKQEIGRHDVADVILETRQPVAFDLTSESETTGRFVIVDGYDVAGGGIITAAVPDDQDNLRSEARLRDFSWIHGSVSAEDRAKRFGHRPALVMFVGKAGVGKQRYARALEKALFTDGRHPYFIDGTNVLMGVDHDLTADATQAELVRRFGEVAYLLLTSGVILVSTTNAIGLADHSAVQALIGDMPSLVIDVDPSGNSTQPCDLRIRGNEAEADVLAKITALLKAKSVIS
jgi:bifunctional enzyme CysN/CysC